VRVIRRIFGVLLALIGLIVAVLGGAAAFWLIGPDNTVRTGEQPLSSKGLAIASTPEMLDRNGPVLHVDVRSTKGTPVFVGVGRDFDVESYLKGTAHSRLVQLEYPIAPGSLLVMHSDGLSARWDLRQRPELLRAHPAVIAAVLYRDHGRERDDATVVVVDL